MGRMSSAAVLSIPLSLPLPLLLYPWSVVLLTVALESDDDSSISCGVMDINAVVVLELLLAFRSKKI